MPPRHNKFEIKQADFKLFLALWNQTQKLSTPDLHFEIASWLEGAYVRGDKKLLLMAFRSSGKSTLVGLFCAWLLYRNPDLRILVLAADFTLAQKMVRNVKRIIERHPLTGRMRPDRADQWANDRFTVKRTLERRDPSMKAAGVTSNITGSRADMIICDDVEVPNTSDSVDKREQLRERLCELMFVQNDHNATQLYVGTPHTYHSIYADKPRTEFGEEEVFLKGFKRLKIPILDRHGESVWPERFGDAHIKDLKLQSGPNRFKSQMMLEPVNIADGRLDASLLQIYDAELDYTKELRTLFLNGKKLLSSSAWWDPAYGSAKGDRSVFAILFMDEAGHYFLHHLAYIKTGPLADVDEATQQAREIARLAKAHYLPSLTVEANGIGKFLPNILRGEMNAARVPCRVQEFYNSRSKDIRILDAFDGVLAARKLHVHKNVLKTEFVTEMQEWQPGKSRGYDDGLDAVAGALAQAPVRMKRHFAKGNQGWPRNGKQHRANTNFKV